MPTSRQRRSVITVFFLFMLLHQTDKLLIGPLTTPIMESFRDRRSARWARYSPAR